MASRAEWSGGSLCCEGTAPDPGDLVSDERGESSLEGTGARVQGTGVDSLDGRDSSDQDVGLRAWRFPREASTLALEVQGIGTELELDLEVPETVERALEIDAETNTTFWQDAMAREMSAIGVVFDVVDEAVASPVGHFVFGVRSGSLQRRARFVLEESSAESVVVTPVVDQLERAEGMDSVVGMLQDLEELVASACESSCIGREEVFADELTKPRPENSCWWSGMRHWFGLTLLF